MNYNDIIEVLIIVLLIHEIRECFNTMRKRRRMWVRELYEDRDINGLFATSFEKMYNNDPEQFKKMVRVNKDVFDLLFELVGNRLEKYSHRPSITGKCRLFLALAYLAHGGSQQIFATAFKMARCTVNKIVKETCDVLWSVLGSTYLSVPDKHKWKRIASDFHTMWNFPNCVGAIDGKHIQIKCPPNSGSLFYNYKSTFSIVLMASCDANYMFTSVDIGAYGSQSDGGVLSISGFGQKLFSGELDLPEDDFLPESDLKFPYYLVGDAAFPLKSCLMRPYPGWNLPRDRETFNMRLSRARRVIENAFGIMTARWRILLSPLYMLPESAEIIVKAIVILHNFVKTHDSNYCPTDYVDRYEGDTVIHGLWRQEVETPLRRYGRRMGNNATRAAFALRDLLKDYICSHPL